MKKEQLFKDLLELLQGSEETIMDFELVKTPFGLNMRGGWYEDELKEFAEEINSTLEEIKELFNEYLKPAIYDFSKAFDRFLSKKGIEAHTKDLSKED